MTQFAYRRQVAQTREEFACMIENAERVVDLEYDGRSEGTTVIDGGESGDDISSDELERLADELIKYKVCYFQNRLRM